MRRRPVPEAADNTDAVDEQRDNWRLALPVFYLLTAVCAAFTAVAELGLWARLTAAGYTEAPGFRTRIAIKGFLFLALLGGSAWALVRSEKPVPPRIGIFGTSERPSGYSRAILLLSFCFVCTLILPNLSLFPWTAPDELYHLIVARNLAEHGAYASGSPDTQLVYFDPYDSIGPSLIMPVAASFKTMGTRLVSARALMAGLFLAFSALVYFFVKPVYGAAAAAWGVFFTSVSFGSIYLARTLYGEVPAFALFLGGLILWRKSLHLRVDTTYAFLSGICFGLAALTKSFILIALFAFAGAWLYDRLTARTILWRHVLIPASGVLLVVFSWFAVQFYYRELVTEEVSLFIYYVHHLIFGFDSVQTTLGWIVGQPITLAVGLAAFALAVPAAFKSSYDPATVVLLSMAILFAYWWVFFTPGNIQRYMWYSWAAAGMYTGVLVERCRARLEEMKVLDVSHLVAGIMMAAAFGTGLARTVELFPRVYGGNQMADDYALVEYVRRLPPEAKLATSYWPIKRSLNFFANRAVTLTDDWRATLNDYDATILRETRGGGAAEWPDNALRFGHYIVVPGPE